MSLLSSDNYKIKYLKYKTKYLELQTKLKINNLLGGGVETAKNAFFKKIFSNRIQMYELFNRDIFLKNKLNLSIINFPEILERTSDELKKILY